MVYKIYVVFLSLWFPLSHRQASERWVTRPENTALFLLSHKPVSVLKVGRGPEWGGGGGCRNDGGDALVT